jgi:hypothetical protein
MTGPRRMLAAGAIITVLGIAIAGTAPVPGTRGGGGALSQPIVGGVLVVLGWALFAWAIHRFGRASQD